MATGFNDALQLFQGGTNGTTNNNNFLDLPDGSQTLSDLIKLNFNFRLDPNIPTPESYNIYIWNDNEEGEIRFHTKDAKNYNDFNKDYFTGNYIEPRLDYNAKIGKDGKFYYYHNYTITNPAKLSGWYELDANITEIDQALIALDVVVGTNTLANLANAQAIIATNTNVSLLTDRVVVLEVNDIDNKRRLTNLEANNIVEETGLQGYGNDIAPTIEQLAEAQQNRTLTNYEAQNITNALQTQKIEFSSKYGTLYTSFINKGVEAIVALGILAAIYGAIKAISDDNKKKIYEDEMIRITDSLTALPLSAANNTLVHTGLTIVSGNGGFNASTKEFIVPIQKGVILKFGILDNNAYIIVVDNISTTNFTVGETITINKNLINNGSGNLVLTVSSLGTLKLWTELKNTYLQNKIFKINTKNRRKERIIGHDDINTDQFTNSDATYTDYDEEGAETINYKVLKSRINLLPSGANDVNVYTSTGRIGIGTATPTTKLHIYDDIANETKLFIQNNYILGGITASPTATATGTTGVYTYQSFTYITETAGTGTGQTLYTITVPNGGLVCDMLIVGGGGSGSQAHGGGGGAGAVIFMKDVNMNGDYTIKIGKGGVCGNSGTNGLGGKGKDTEIFKTDNITNKIVAEGGGGGGQLSNANGGSGGSGGGGDAYNLGVGVGGSATAYTPILDGITGIKYGNNGGNAIGNPGHGGGGGGAGGVGENATGVYNTGNDEAERAHGGVGIKSATISSVNYDFKTLFGSSAGGVLEADGFVYFGGGGGNGRWKAPNNNGEGGNGGLGGGGKGGWGGGTSTPNGGKGYPATANTGGGGGGGADYTPIGGDGGSGVVIIRYLTPSSSASLELVRGTTTDGNYDWKLGNYAGDFKIKKSVDNVEINDFIIKSSGNVGIGTDPHGTHKLNVDGTVIATNFVGNYVGAGKLSTSVEVLAYKATDPTIRVESGASGTPILEFMRGTSQDVNKDYRFITDNEIFKIQYQDNITTYNNDVNQLVWLDNDEAIIYKTLECKANVGVGTVAAAPLHIYNATNNILRLQTAPVDGTNAIEFVRGSGIDPLTDFRLFTDTFGKFKIQYANNVLAYGASGTDLLELSPTNVNIYKDTQVSGKVGIGTSAGTLLHTYHETENVLRLGTGTWGKSSLEFFVAREIGNLTNFRIINDYGDFKIQYNNNALNYGDAGTDLFKINHADAVIYKKLESKFNIGIGTTPHATYKLDAVGTVNATAFRGNGAELTDLDAAKITTGQINLDRITLTAAKLYQNFNTTNFAVIDDKIDLPPNYSFSITDYDSQTLFNPSVERKYKGKMTANYDDRNGVYKLITTDNRTDNVAVLNYKVGDKISIRNTANTVNDYLLESGSKYFNSLLLLKRPTNRPLNWAVNDPYSILLYEWFSSDGLEGRAEARVRTPTNRYFPFTTVMTFIIEAGFNYYLAKLYNQTETAGGTVIVVQSPYGDDTNDFNRAFGAGQTFKLQSTGSSAVDDYIPKDYIAADIGIASDRRLGGVKKGRGVAIDATTGELSSTPVSVDLINSMNTAHFTNNLATGKIDFNTSLIPATPTSANLVNILNTTQFENNVGTSRVDIKTNWKPTTAGTADAVAWSGVSSVPASWTVSQIPDLGTAKITSGIFDVARIPDLGTAKITSGIFDVARIPDLGTAKITSGIFDVARIPDLGTTKITSGIFDVARIPDLGTAKITSGIFDVLRIPDLGTAKITSGTFADARIPSLDTGKITTGTFADARIPNLDTGKITTGTFADARIPNLDTGKITTGTFADARIPSLAISKTTGLQGALDGKAPTSHTHIISDITGLQTALDGKAPTSHTHIIANITGLQTALDGKAPTSHTHIIADVSGLQTALDGKLSTLTAGNGITIIGSTISTLWRNPIIYTTFNSVHTTQRVRIGSITEAEALLQLTGDATNGGTLKLDYVGGTPNIEIVRATGTTSTNYNWNILNDNSFKLQSKNLAAAYTTMFEISGAGDVGIGTAASTANKLDVNGYIKCSGFYTTFLSATSLLRAEELRVFGYGLSTVGGTSTLMVIANTINNQLRIQQTYLGANDIKFSIFQTDNAVEYTTPSITFYKGKIGIGTTTPATYPLTVGGDVNITGDYRVNGALFKPATSGNADTATKLATARNIAGALFDGSADIAIDYTSLNNKPITVVPLTTNLQVSSTYNMIVGTVASGTIERLSVGGNIRATGNITAETNLTATGTSTLTGRVGIGKAPHATYACDVNGTLNATSVLVGGNAITGSKWTNGAVATNIYYNSGNVGIGATTTSDVDDNTSFAIPTARLYVRGGETAGGTCDVVIRGGVAGQNNGKARLWLASDASYSSYIQSEHIGGGATCLTMGTATGDILPKERFKIWGNGAVGIQDVGAISGNTGGYLIANGYMNNAGSLTIGNVDRNYGGGSGGVGNIAGFAMECLNSTEFCIHDYGQSIHSFMYYTGNTFRIGRNMGWGAPTLYITGPLICNNYIESDATILSKNAVYARNGYDTKIRSDSGGMFLEMGTIGTADLLSFGAYSGATFMDSGASRDIYFRTAGYRWLFQNNGYSWNGLNVSNWSSFSDHRIKENIIKANLQTCYDNVKNITVYRFNYIDGFSKGVKRDRTQLGFIAQQVQQHFPKSTLREKIRIDDKREIPDLCGINIDQLNFTLFGAVKQLMKVVEKQSKRIKKLEEILGIVDDDIVEDDADEPYERIVCDEVDIDDIEPSEPEGV